MEIIKFLTNLDVSIYVYLGLGLFLVAGLLFKDKPKNIQDYALGIKPFSMPVLVATMTATLVGGGSTIGNVNLFYNDGFLFVIPGIIGYSGYILFVRYILPKFDIYYGELSIASVLSRIYGDSVEKFAGVVAYMYCFGALALQVKAVGIIIEYALGYNSIYATILSFAIITIYSAMGGVRSVICTDVIQFLIFIVVLPIIAAFALEEGGGIYTVFEKNTWNVRDNFNLLSYISLFVFSLTPNISPTFIHRLLVGRNKNENKSTIYFTALFQMICSFFAIIVAAVAISKYQGIDHNMVLFKTMEDIIQNKLLHALFAVAMLAVILSTADSLMNTGAIIFVENVIKDKIKNDSVKLIVLKIVTVLSGFIGLFIALKIESLLGIIWFVAQYYFSIIFVPFIGGLLIKNANPLMFWASSITGFLSYTLLNLLLPEIGYTIYVISLSMSFVVFMLTKYLVKNNIIDNEKSLIKFKNFTENIIKQMNIPVSKLGYAILPIPFFTIFTQIITNKIIINTMLFSAVAGLVGTSFIFIDTIFKNQRSVIRNCYILFSIMYCFPFLSVYLYYTMLNSNVAFANMLISCTLLAIIFSSKSLVMFMSIGALLGSITFIALQPFVLREFLTQAIILAAIVIYIGVISYFILRTKEADIKKFIDDLIKKTSTEDSKKSLQLVNQYAGIIDIVKKHEKAKEGFLEKRSEFTGYVESDDIVTANIDELVEKLKDYLSLAELEREIKFNIQNTIKNITITKPLSMLYTIIFSIAYYMISFDKDLIKININCKNKRLYFRYSLENLKLSIKEIKKYVKDVNRPDGIMSFELIEKIISKQDDMELKMSQNAIILGMSAITGEISRESAKFINLSSEVSEKPKILN
jgi:Na+/proline symporter